jgi:hypothetical protein
MPTKVKTLRSLRENQEHLPVHPSDASSEVPDSLLGKLGKRAVKAAHDGHAVAQASGKYGNAQSVHIPEEEDEMHESSHHDELLPIHPSDAAEQVPDHFSEEEEDLIKALESYASDDEVVAEEEDKELSEEEEKELVKELEDEKLSEEEEKELEEEEKKLEEEEEEHVKKHVESLTHDEELPEEFRVKAGALFEAAIKNIVANRSAKIAKKLSSIYAKKLNKRTKKIAETLTEQVDGYLDYVVEEWVKENEVAIESGIKVQLAEEFFSGMKTLLENHNVKVPSVKRDILVEAENKAAELERELNETHLKNLQLRKEVTDLKRNAIIRELSEDLVKSDGVRFAKYCENLAFDDEKSFKAKLKVIKESYFPAKASAQAGDLSASLLAEGGLDSNRHEKREVSTEADLVAEAISRQVKNRNI